METTAKNNGRIVAIVAMFFLFAMISFVTNLAAPLGTIWKNNYDWSGMLGNMMNFLAYLFMGIPAGNLLTKIGYKKTSLYAMIVGLVGLVFQWLSGIVGAETSVFTVSGQAVTLNFIIYLLGAFICGFCVCMLNTVVNPMLNQLGGGGNRGNQLVQIGGSFNSLAGTLTPLFVGMLIGQVTNTTSMGDVAPLLYIAMGVFVAAFIIISCVSIPEPHLKQGAQKSVSKKSPYSPWSFRHTTLGVIGIFFYVGIEIGIPGVLIFYLSDSSVSGITENATAVAGGIAAIYWLLMLVGRLVSSVISGKVSSRAQLIVVSTTAIILIAIAIFMPSSIRMSMPAYSAADGFSMALVPTKALLLVLCGLCTSVMWGGIFNLAVEGLGKYTAQASGIFMMMVVGGGIMPLIQNAIATNVGYMASYWLVIAMLAYLLFYGLVGSKNVNTDIPVDEDADPRNL
ncbi:MAG: MFS transporter [Duncaniella sp.]|uniref:MFS transporter n=1 Tax=Duncaniella sp. TaxID=2518496 RepID=UPI0023D35A49|nr:MFS transporter [Duncaniella sp.]MDE5988825.1 MFS transporter [Duncaniella sp.]